MRKLLPILAILVLASCGGSSAPPVASAPETISRQEIESSGHQSMGPMIDKLTAKPARPAAAAKAAPRAPAPSASPRAPETSRVIPEPPTAGIQFGRESANSAQKSAKKPTKSPSDEVLDQLRLASMSFTTPSKINIKETGKAKFIVDLRATPAELEAMLNGKGKISSGKVLVSKIISVEIIAAGFHVEAITPERQALSNVEPTIWEWELIPTKPGQFEVYLVVNAEVSVDNTRASRRIQTFESLVYVEVTPIQQTMGWVEKYWQWAVTGLLVPLIAWGWKRWRKEKE